MNEFVRGIPEPEKEPSLQAEIGLVFGYFQKKVQIKNEFENEKLENEASDDPDYVKENELSEEIKKIDYAFSAWEMKVAQFMLSEESLEKKVAFWQEYENLKKGLGKFELDALLLRNGILGLVTSYRLLMSSGVDRIEFPDEAEDVEKKVDLKAYKGGVSFLIQVKSHKGGELNIHSEEITAKNITGADRHDSQSKQILFNYSEYLKRQTHKEYVPLWLDLNHLTGVSLKQDEMTGEPIGNQENVSKMLAQEFETILSRHNVV